MSLLPRQQLYLYIYDVWDFLMLQLTYIYQQCVCIFSCEKKQVIQLSIG